jgi:hypothetical protein
MGDTPDRDATTLIVTCDDPETLMIQIYAWDSAYNPYAVQPDGTVGGPNYDFCETYLLVQDNMFGICGVGTLATEGTVSTEEDVAIEGVDVELSGQGSSDMVTAADGFYIFNALTLGYDYSITPELDANPMNGVSTFDLILISKHILGVEALDSPYKMIAADVNNSESISTLDLIQLRKLILGIDTEFSNNTSWRFVDAAYVFPDATNPWAADFPEVININDIATNMVGQDFVGVKIGDVNSSVVANSFSSVDDRNSGETFLFNVEEQAVKAGNSYTVSFTAEEIAKVQGYQLTLTFDKAALHLTDIVYGVATEENFGMNFVSEGMITTSWDLPTGQAGGEAKADDVLFSLVFSASVDANLSEVLGVSSRYTLAEAYKHNDETMDVGINFSTGTVAAAGYDLYQNTPNPFKGETVIGYNLPEAAQVTLTIHDVAGKSIQLIRTEGVKGYNSVTVNSKDLLPIGIGTGVLFYTLETADYTATRKMIIVE